MMDNITHSLIGAIIGIKFARRRNLPTKPLVLTSMVAGNLPDLDILYASAISKPFGYILHHRGHTHTIVGALLCTLICYLGARAIYRFKDQGLPSSLKIGLLWMAVIGPFLHIGIDWLNTYGVHPFWPLSGRWVYGDTLFIIEPTMWIGLGMAVFMSLEKQTGRPTSHLVALAPVALGIFLMIGLGKVPPLVLLFWLLVFALTFLWSSNVAKQNRPTPFLITSGAILLLFVAGRSVADSQNLDSRLEYEHESLVQRFYSPAPANPFCWAYYTISLDSSQIIYRRDFVQLLEGFLRVDCEKTALSDFETITFKQSEVDQFRDNCHWNAFLLFSRMPGITECVDKGEQYSSRWCTADYRFRLGKKRSKSDNGGKHNFTTLPLPANGNCPTLLPGWEPPLGHPIPKERLTSR